MTVRIPHGKGDKAREVPLSLQLLEQLRTYYRSLPRRNGWMFPSLASKRANDPITDKVVWHACHESTRRAGITKPVHPHTLRHYVPFRIMSGAGWSLRRRGPRFRALSFVAWHFELHSFGLYRLLRNSRRRSPGL